jgi:hypothetical protein
LLWNQERRLIGNQQLVVRAHIAICPLCQQECRLLSEIDTVPLNPPRLAQRIIEALFVRRSSCRSPYAASYSTTRHHRF